MNGTVLLLSVILLLPAEGTAQTAAPSQAEASTTSPDLDEANKLSRQVLALFNEEKYGEALPLAKRALEIQERVLGSKHELVATSLTNIAEIYIAQKNYGEAESLYKRALSILENKWGAESDKLVTPLQRLALIGFAHGNFGEAEKRYQRALAITEKVAGPNALATGQALAALAIFYDRREQYKKAVDFYQRSLAVQEKMVDPTSTGFVNLLHRCACALIQVGQRDRAKEYQERAEKSAPSVPVKQGGGVLQGSAIHRVQPAYPVAARNSRIGGRVVVEVVVDECGRVIKARRVIGPIELSSAAIRAAEDWRFTPTILGGRPVRVIGTITFNFTL
jgi:TonB family protein